MTRLLSSDLAVQASLHTSYVDTYLKLPYVLATGTQISVVEARPKFL